MMLLFRARKTFATAMMMVMAAELLIPTTASALTSGPAQPEMEAFKPIGANDMVDLFSGDFSYNIPLVDVGGYPLNLSYQSGSSIDDEASWVGHGWTLNPGAVNRQLRGIPDDFNGSDQYTREKSVKPQTTVGAKLSGTLDLVGVPTNKTNTKKKKRKISLVMPTLSLMVKADNYRGIGVDFGVNTGLSLTDAMADEKTTSSPNADPATEYRKKKSKELASLNVGLTASSFDGASANVNFSIQQRKVEKNDRQLGMSIGFPYNSRSGLAMMTLSGSSNKTKTEKLREQMSMSTSINFNDQPFSPNIDLPRFSEQFTFTVHGGIIQNMIYLGGGISGFYSKQGLATNKRTQGAFGTLYGDRARTNLFGRLDFDREKDIPYTSEVPYLPIPVQTHDIFSASSQSGGGQYRLYRGSAAAFFDPLTTSGSIITSAGIELGAPVFGDAGFDLYNQLGFSRTNKWTKNNRFLLTNDFIATQPGNLLYEPVYFKKVGEPVPVDPNFLNRISGTEAVAASITSRYVGKFDGGESENRFRSKSAPYGTAINGAIQRNVRDVRNNSFAYLTASEAALHGLDKMLQDFDPGKLSLNGCDPNTLKSTIARVGGYRKPHHISEITITADDGKRTVYGIPVYNTYQEDVTFSTTTDPSARNRGLVRYARDVDDLVNANKKGLDNMVNREITPAYATGYLLTGILSPEYRDLTGNGITDDDHGDAVKFNYTRLNGLYKWRTPYAYGADTANYNEGLMSDPDDDKANYSYGEKEVWYMHSVESKTMVAYFILEDRDDGLGVQDKHGASNTQVRLKRLRQIRLFSKADIKAANGILDQVTPIKTVHFEYDYSLVPGLPNNLNQGGKLTLKKVWFTYGLNNKGRLHPYEFVYSSDNPGYSYRQYDRWGSWKDPSQNPGGMNNSEFPYTDQRRSNTDRYVSAGQLVSIKLPSGGAINVTYEADDYAYVQNKRAAVMAMVAGAVDKAGSPSQEGLIDADEIIVDLPWPATLEDIKKKCFNSTDKLYFKFLIDLDGKDHKEYVPGYANIISATGAGTQVGNKFSQAKIKLQRSSGVNPIAAAGWQFIRLELPKYAYPGSQNLNDPGSDLSKAIKALGTAAKSFAELFSNFESTAKRRKYSDKFVAARSWVRVGVPERKLGGGSRVKRVEVSDNWAALSNTPGAVTATLAQVYDYTTKDAYGTVISSGVASYEPALGGDENPFKQPVPYKEKQFLGLNTNRYIELPVGESFFPSPSVGYSKVTVRNVGSGDAESVNRTGTVVNEFFTSRDFPTKVTALPIERRKPSAKRILSLIGVQVTDLVGLSQGYSIEVNDMHGKPKSTTVLNVAGDLISKVENFYKTVNEKAASQELSNTVKVVDANNVVSDGMVGMDVEIFHDSREQVTENTGVAVKFSAGLSNFLFVPVPFMFPGIAPNYDKRSYRALSTVKLVQRFGIVDRVKKTENGSSITTTNLLWDGVTGNVLLTSTQNEFNDPVFSFTYPAHWEYAGMGAAYTNAGTIYQGVSTLANGSFVSAAIAGTLFPGDELVDLGSSNRYWVARSRTNTSATLTTRLIDTAGNTVQLANARLKLVRPGRRNMSNTAIGTVISLRSPIVNNALVVNAATNVLDTKAFTYNEEWTMPVSNYPQTVFKVADISNDCVQRFVQAAFAEKGTTVSGTNYYSFFSSQADNKTVFSIMQPWNAIFPGQSPPCTGDFFSTEPKQASQNPFFLWTRRIDTIAKTARINNNDSGRLGSYPFKIDSVQSTPLNRFVNQRVVRNMTTYLQSINPKLTRMPGGTDSTLAIYRFTVGRTVHLDTCGSKGISSCNPGPDSLLFRISIKLPIVPVVIPCATPLNRPVNPYVAGILGNWRMRQSYAFQENRTNPRPAGTTSTNIRTGGAYNAVVPFWSYNATNGWVPVATTELRWIASNEMTLFNTKGLELENRDALNRFSSAQFGYLESMPVAVASNALNREIGYEGFEDTQFNLDCNVTGCPIPHQLDVRSMINGVTNVLDAATVHSGKFSLRTSQNITLTRQLAPVDASFQLLRPANFTYDANGRYILNGNESAKGFSPLPNKDYVISFWVRDNNPSSNKVNLSVLFNGSPIFINTNVVQVVEKWKRVEARFRTSTSGNQTIEIALGGQTMNIDDIRIHPYDAQMKSFVYDPGSTRLMAELDENNFSTFYEYDDEGVLIRVKKETERGIMTIKETRSSMKKSGS